MTDKTIYELIDELAEAKVWHASNEHSVRLVAQLALSLLQQNGIDASHLVSQYEQATGETFSNMFPDA